MAGKVGDINRLINHQFTHEELDEKLRKQGALDTKKNVRKRFDLERDLQFAKLNGDHDEAERLQKELNQILNPTLSWGTSLNKQESNKTLTEAERVHQINLRNQKLNYENVRRAQLEERKAARKTAAAVARGEATADPFMRVRTIAKTHHDVSEKPQEPAVKTETETTTTETVKSPASNTKAKSPASRLTPKKPKNGFMITYSNNDDENIAALDLDIDIEI